MTSAERDPSSANTKKARFLEASTARTDLTKTRTASTYIQSTRSLLPASDSPASSFESKVAHASSVNGSSIMLFTLNVCTSMSAGVGTLCVFGASNPLVARSTRVAIHCFSRSHSACKGTEHAGQSGGCALPGRSSSSQRSVHGGRANTARSLSSTRQNGQPLSHGWSLESSDGKPRANWTASCHASSPASTLPTSLWKNCSKA
mmetsp:Transcript_30803/g.67966  ORF Transcript_30803/g.67966 Transcript_30803/m.67966 type:complete len:204 (+) Transcript_30803:569-1180(+)